MNNVAFEFLSTELLVYIIYCELFIVFCLTLGFFSLINKHFLLFEKLQKKRMVANILIDMMVSKIEIEEGILQLRKFSKLLLLRQMRLFNQRFNDSDWMLIKEKIAKSYLLPAARQLAGSNSSKKRNFAANCFSLVPLAEDNKFILKLLDDPIFLVSSIAAQAAMKLEIRTSFYKILLLMSRSEGFTYCYYRDLLIDNMTIRNFAFLQKIAAQNLDPAVHLACLHLLISRRLSFSATFLKRDIKSSNPAIRMAALKIFVRYPQHSFFNLFLECTKSSDPDIRIEGIKGIEFFPSPIVYFELTKMLSDNNWQVRLQASKSLKLLAPEGEAILRAQDPGIDLKAYEVAQYVLNFY